METKDSTNKGGADTEDSVEAAFGGDYSDDTLELLRDVRKPYVLSGVKVNPEKDPFGWVLTQPDRSVLPPKAAEALAADTVPRARALDHLRRTGLDTEERDLVEQKRQLVAGISREDLDWLKMKAYLKAKQMLGLNPAEPQAPETQDKPAAPFVPPYKGKRFMDELSEGGASAYSTDSEWAPDWDTRGHLMHQPHPLTNWREQLEAVYDQQLAMVEGYDQACWELRQASLAAEAEEELTSEYIKEYTPMYLEELKLREALKRQGRARKGAFLGSLSIVLGASALRWLLGRRRGGAGGKQSSPTSTVAVAST